MASIERRPSDRSDRYRPSASRRPPPGTPRVLLPSERPRAYASNAVERPVSEWDPVAFSDRPKSYTRSDRSGSTLNSNISFDRIAQHDRPHRSSSQRSNPPSAWDPSRISDKSKTQDRAVEHFPQDLPLMDPPSTPIVATFAERRESLERPKSFYRPPSFVANPWDRPPSWAGMERPSSVAFPPTAWRPTSMVSTWGDRPLSMASITSDAPFFDDFQEPGKGSRESSIWHVEPELKTEVPEKPELNLPPALTFPDGGATAWLQAAGAFMLYFNTWGLINAFGAFQQYYVNVLLTDQTSSKISWIGSLAGFLLVGGGVFTCPLVDQGYCRSLNVIGAILAVTGMMLASICKEYWQFMLAQGLLIGAGLGCLFGPSVNVIPQYFKKRRALAMGIATSGSSAGGIIYSVMFHVLQPRIGFGWAVRCIGFVILATLIVPISVMKLRRRNVSDQSVFHARRFFDKAAWKLPHFRIWNIAILFGFIGMYIPFFYVQLYGASVAHITGSLDFYLLALLNTGSFFGRIIPSYIADKTGPLNTIGPCMVMVSVLGYSWMAVSNTAGMVIFCLIYGFFSGAFISLTPAVLASMCPHISVMGVWMGMTMIPMAAGLLVGSPIAGAILHYGWTGLQAFCGSMVLLSALFMFWTRVSKDGGKFKTRS